MLRNCLFAFIFIILFQSGYSQNISAYSDYRDYFYAFDNGIKKELDYRPIKSYKIGWNCVVFENYSGTLKIYYKGEIYKIFESAFGGMFDYSVSKYLMIAKLNNQIKIFDNGKTITLSGNAGSYMMSDSLVAFQDNNKNTFNAYYKGEIIQLEDLLVSDGISHFKVGSNIIAYINDQNEFKLFYHGKISKLFIVENELQYDVGQDIVAYNNYDDLSFNVFYKNKNYKIEENIPLSFIAGNDCVAYIDNTGKFKLFKDGNVSTISEIQPDFYKVKDDIIVYSEQNYLKVYYKDNDYLLEHYIPDSYQYDQSSVAYVDHMGNLKLFKDGKIETITNETIKSFDLNGSVLKYTTWNDSRFYYNGILY